MLHEHSLRRTPGSGASPPLEILQWAHAIDLREASIERPERHMPRLSRDFDDEAVRKTERRPVAKEFQRCCDDVGVLNHQALMVEQHVDCCRNLLRAALEDSIEHP